MKALHLRMVAVFALTACHTLSFADVPTHFYCGGAFQYFANGWWAHSGPNGNVGQLIPLAAAPKVCPNFSATMIYPNGIGGQSLPPSGYPSGGGTIGGANSLYSSTVPQELYGIFGIMGQVMGELFGGPEYTPNGGNVSAELDRIRKYSSDMVGALNSDAAFVRSQLPLHTNWARSDGNGLRISLGNERHEDAALAARLEAATLARPALPAESTPTKVGAVIELLERGKNISEISGAIPLENVRPSGKSMYGSLDALRVRIGGGISALERQLQHEQLKLTREAGRTQPNRDLALRYVERANTTLGMARLFIANGSSLSATIAEQLIGEARSARYAAMGLSQGQTSVAVINTDGSVTLQSKYEKVEYPSNSLVEDAVQFVSAQRLARTSLTKVESDVISKSGDSKAKGLLLVKMSDALFDNADFAYFSGNIHEAKALAASAVYIMEMAEDGWIPKQASLSPEAKQEAYEFSKSLLGSAFDATQDDVVGETGKLLTEIESLDKVSAMLRDWTDFNSSIVEYIKNPSSDNKVKIAELGVKFGLSATGGAVVTAAVTAGALSAGGGIVIGLAVTVGAEYAAKAIIMKGLEKPGATQDLSHH